MNTLPCLSTSSITAANDIVQSAWLEHGPFAFWLANQLRPRMFVELGAHNGYSYFCFCQAIDKLNIGASCYAVDTWQGDEHAGFYDESIYHSVVSKNEKYRAFSQLMRMRFDEALQYFPDNSIDLLHIDGRHYYDDVKEDFESWLPKLSSSGIILFHDTQVRERNFGVWKLFGELAAKYPNFNFVHGHGLGVLAVGEIPETLFTLFSARGEDVDNIRRSYARLGSVEYLRYALDDAKRHQTAAIREASELAEQKVADAKQHEAAAIREASELAEQKVAEALQQKDLAAEQLQIALDDARRHEAEAAKNATELAQMRAAEQNAAANAQRHNADSTMALARLKKPGDLPKLPRSLNVFGRLFHRSKRRRARDYRLLASSPLFDADWYRTKYPDVVETGWDPILHYLVHGGQEGRQPSAAFDVKEYLAANPDVPASRHTPLVHFLRIGVFENRRLLCDHSTTIAGKASVSGCIDEAFARKIDDLAKYDHGGD